MCDRVRSENKQCYDGKNRNYRCEQGQGRRYRADSSVGCLNSSQVGTVRGTNEVTAHTVTRKEQLVACGSEFLVEIAVVWGGTGFQERIGAQSIGVEAPVATLVYNVVWSIRVYFSDGFHGTRKYPGVG